MALTAGLKPMWCALVALYFVLRLAKGDSGSTENLIQATASDESCSVANVSEQDSHDQSAWEGRETLGGFNPIEMEDVTIQFGKNISLRILQSTSTFCSSGSDDTGLVVWGPSLALSRYLIEDADMTSNWIEGKSILELGCGVGLPSMVAHRLGAETVLATDFRTQTLDHVLYHAEENNTPLLVKRVDWEDRASLPDFDFDVNLVLAADVIYGMGLVEPLFQTLLHLFPESTDSSRRFLLATREGREGIPEFRKLMQMEFQETILMQDLGPTYLPRIWKTSTKTPLSEERWNGKHTIYMYQRRN